MYYYAYYYYALLLRQLRTGIDKIIDILAAERPVQFTSAIDLLQNRDTDAIARHKLVVVSDIDFGYSSP